MHIILYVFDSLRPDRLSCYGYGRSTSPNLDTLAREGILFLNAQAQSTWTRPSAGSILTGAYPPVHGADTMESGLRPGIATLAERLAARGYRCLGFSTNGQVSAATGFARGFQEFLEIDSGTHGVEEATAGSDIVNRLAIPRLSAGSRAPLFLMFWSTDTHIPYDHPRSDGEGAARIRTRLDLTDVFSIGRAEGEEDRSEVDEAYDSAIRFNDGAFGELIRALRDAGIYDDALIIAVSDHGEIFGGSRGEFWKMRRLLGAWPFRGISRAAGIVPGRCWIGHHCVIPYQDLIRVPFIVKFPGARGAGMRIGDRVGLIDAVPTILDLIGEPFSRPPIQGRSLRAAIEGRDDPALRERIVFSHSQLYRACTTYTSAVGPEGKIVRLRHPPLTLPDLRRRPRFVSFATLERLLGERELLFRIGDDGVERRCRPAPGELPRWRMRLAEWEASNMRALRSFPAGASAEVDVIRRLRALGYV